MSQHSSASELWQGVLTRIRDRISGQQFETWFRGIEPGQCSADVLELTVPNAFSKEWLRRKYADLILRAWERENGGQRPALRIRVREDEGFLEPGMAAIIRKVLPASMAPARPETVAPRKAPSGHVLNPDYVFETFIVGAGNRLARAALSAVIERGNRTYNPLFIHGSVGSGKTHLLQAACRAMTEQDPSLQVLYTPCEQFLNQFISAVERGELDVFRNRYRKLDVLVMDDVHLLAQKERTQEEFLHTFNTLYNAGRQILLSADAGPGHIPALSDRLASRFRWGMVCELEPSDADCRFEIARQKATQLGAEIPDEVCRFVAEQVRTNVREVEGAVTRLAGHAALDGILVTEPMAREILRDVIADRRRQVTIDHIAQTVVQHFEVKLSEVQGKRRNQVVVVPRQIGMYLARQLTEHSLGTIGGYFGGRDHSTVLYAVDKVTKKALDDPAFAALLESLQARILAGTAA